VQVRRAGLFAAAAALAVSGASILVLNHPWNIQPHLSRLQAINVSLDGYPPNTFGRVEAKLVGLDNFGQLRTDTEFRLLLDPIWVPWREHMGSRSNRRHQPSSEGAAVCRRLAWQLACLV
jgi:hypothetical protein